MRQLAITRRLMAHDGFGLVEVLAGAAILITIFVGALSMVTNALSVVRSIENRGAANALASEIGRALGVRANCEDNLKDQSFDVTGHSVTSFINEQVAYFTSAGTVNDVVVKNGTNTRFGIRTDRLFLKALQPIDANTHLGELSFKTESGGIQIVRSMPILVDHTAGKVTSCTTGINADLQIRQIMCSIDTNGNFFWDFEAGECRDRRVKFRVTGTRFQAACPSPAYVDYCTREMPSGFVDNFKIPPRTYDNGTVMKVPPDPAECTPKSRAVCECDYAADVDSSKFLTVAICTKDFE